MNDCMQKQVGKLGQKLGRPETGSEQKSAPSVAWQRASSFDVILQTSYIIIYC